jgi:thiol-disulfide isomerase/thioredoxin
MLNASTTLTSSKSFKEGITIVDFFGTWCAPCLRALPHLISLKEDFENNLTIVLVSNETESQLTKFIKTRSNFAFPIIVDEDNSWNAAFQPPALPYTVILRDGKVVSITEAAAITKEKITEWLSVSNTNASQQETNYQRKQIQSTTVSSIQQSKNELVRISQDYIYAAKTDASLTSLAQSLSALSFDHLKTVLSSDNQKKAFWINLYNGYTQAALKENAGRYKKRNAFFKQKNIKVAGEKFSLDDIEHGILRHSKIKWSLGHLNKLFPSKKEKQLRVSDLDYRIHFALNCGAKSCPPIAFYNDESIDAQLDLATRAHLSSEAEFDSVANVIRLPRLMSWFRADFGGKKGMRNILRKYGIIANDARPKIKFKDYDWTLTLNNYTKQNP